MAESIVRAFAGLATVLVLALAPIPIGATDIKLATPQMGWNSYNHYGCVPTEEIMKTNAQGLVDHGLAALGYVYVTPDCGWMTSERDATGQLVWNTTLFPSGGPALGDFLHGIGLKFGLYSGAGYYQCDSVLRPASLGHETLDAQTFASWGADSLKYDASPWNDFARFCHGGQRMLILSLQTDTTIVIRHRQPISSITRPRSRARPIGTTPWLELSTQRTGK
jgi:hypothetical protein